NLVTREVVERGLRDLRASVLMLPRERYDGLVRALPFREVRLDGMEVLDRPLDPACDHRRPCLPADLAQPNHLLMEVVDHDLGLEPDGMLVALHIPPKLLPRPLDVELGIAGD